MLFVTDRIPNEHFRTQHNRTISFDIEDIRSSQNLHFCERRARSDYIEIGSKDFFSRLKNGPDPKVHILLYIHGFNNTFEKSIFPMAIRLQKLINQTAQKKLVYVVPLIWPCDNDEKVSLCDYWEEQDSAAISGKHFYRIIRKFDEWRLGDSRNEALCGRRVDLFAHSMGARVLLNALGFLSKKSGGNVPRYFRNVFLMAPDIVNSIFETGEKGRLISDSSRNVVVYHANDDLAMTASSGANAMRQVYSARLGMTGPRDLELCPRNVYAVDCDNINLDFDPDYGHTYFLKNSAGKVSPVIDHMVKSVKSGRVQSKDRNHQLGEPPIEDVQDEEMN